MEKGSEDLLPEDDVWNTYSFDEQCKFAHGGFYKRYNGRYQGQIIRDYTHCTQLYCWDDVTLLLKTLPGAPALSGTRCDMGKICYMGRCQNVESIGPTQRPTKDPSTIPGVIQNVCDSINTFVTSIINIFG